MWKIAWLLEKAYRWVVFVILITAARLHVASTQDKRDAWICSPHPSRLWMSRNQTEDLFIFWRNTTSEYKCWPREVTGIKQHTWTPFSFAKNSHVKYITRGKTKIIEFAFCLHPAGRHCCLINWFVVHCSNVFLFEFASKRPSLQTQHWKRSLLSRAVNISVILALGYSI